MREYYPIIGDQQSLREQDNFLWCADMQKDRNECLYCDRYHYKASFAKELADYICQLCVERRLLEAYLEGPVVADL
jgi:hypothetical protein